METITKTLGDLRIGEPVRFRNLAMFPLFGPSRPEPGYLTLDEALAAGTAKVTEVSESGIVPELRFVNRGGIPVFLMDGEELVGAKQNRVLNISILADAHSTLKIPVSCVEAGRWNHVSREFQASPRAHFAEGRARKNHQVSQTLFCVREARADQGEIWRTIHDKAERLSARSATGAMSDIYEKVSANVEDFVRELKAGDGQTGGLFALGGSVSGLDLFDSTDSFGKLLPKLVRSYALDAIDALVMGAGDGEPPAMDAAASFIASAAGARWEQYPAAGLGTDARLSAEGMAGGALCALDRLIHVGAFSLHTANNFGGRRAAGARLIRSSARRRNREGTEGAGQ